MNPLADAAPGLKLAGEELDRYWISLPEYVIDPRYLGESIAVGDGVNMYRPGHPVVGSRRAFPPMPGRDMAIGFERSSDFIQDTTVFKESLNEQESASVLSAYFKASYGLASFDAALEQSKREQGRYHTVYVLLEHHGETDPLAPHKLDTTWLAPPASEELSGSREVLMQFLQDYGSHYVSSITYGLRIGIQAKLSTSSKSSQTDLAANVKGAFGSFSASGGGAATFKEKLERMNVDLTLEASSGGVQPPRLLVVRGFDDTMQFLSDLRDDKVKFLVAPISVTLKPYWNTLAPEWKKTRAALSPIDIGTAAPAAPYGVPRGTILAWHPTHENLREGEGGAPAVSPPSGWALCDGDNGTPDLRDRFIMGTATPGYPPGGSADHTHSASTAASGSKKDVAAAKGLNFSKEKVNTENHAHGVTVDKAAHLPPYVPVIFIMKL